MGDPVYLDYNATAPIRPEVIDAVAGAMTEPGNPSSVHGFGRAARRIVEDAREKVAALIGADPAGVVFTSGGTEANDLAIQGSRPVRIAVSAVEHPAVLAAAEAAAKVPVGGDGVSDLAALRTLLEDWRGAAPDDRLLVSLMLANNETGVLQPVREAAEIARELDAVIHTDAVQATGKVAVDLTTLGVDMVSLSAHKIGGPNGIGALVLRDGVEVAARIRGGGQERGRRGGTENVAAIAGFGVAADLAGGELDAFTGLAALRDGLERRLLDEVPGLTIFGRGSPRLPNTSCIAMPGVAADTQLISFDTEGFAISAGSACSSGKVATSPVLDAMGATPEAAGGTIRVSLGLHNTAEHVEAFAAAWLALCRRVGACGARAA